MSDLSFDERVERTHRVLRGAADAFRGKLAIVSSFGAESAVLLHLAASVAPDTPVIFLNTGKHFAQTLSYRKKLAAEFGLADVRDIRPDVATLSRADPRGDLWRRDPDACCAIRKVRPLSEALDGFDAWISGRKRFQGGLRGALPVFEASKGAVKVNPLAAWTMDDIETYGVRFRLPAHPLVEQGFASIGCWPCTKPVEAGARARSGRWRGSEKTECGIHQI
ncbi:MAG: phosphoadenylyl-sulfate reductase [Alphaproteobacteria bacterium]|nr:phosphoadenylyl-sulfate reductase [Alphaproteobacteria bacterium]